MSVYLIHKTEDESNRAVGYSTVPHSSSDESETTVKTTEKELADVFQDAKEAGVDELEGTGDPIKTAIDEPLRYYDYLILEVGEIVFDTEYTRKNE